VRLDPFDQAGAERAEQRDDERVGRRAPLAPRRRRRRDLFLQPRDRDRVRGRAGGDADDAARSSACTLSRT
jgi:hypothetical protein